MKTKKSFLEAHKVQFPHLDFWCHYFELVYGEYDPAFTPDELLERQVQSLVIAKLTTELIYRKGEEAWKTELEQLITPKVILLQCHWIAEHLSLELMTYIQGKQLLINYSSIVAQPIVAKVDDMPLGEELDDLEESQELEDAADGKGRVRKQPVLKAPTDPLTIALRQENVRTSIGGKKIDMFLKANSLLDKLKELEKRIFFSDRKVMSQFSELSGKLASVKAAADRETVEDLKGKRLKLNMSHPRLDHTPKDNNSGGTD